MVGRISAALMDTELMYTEDLAQKLDGKYPNYLIRMEQYRKKLLQDHRLTPVRTNVTPSRRRTLDPFAQIDDSYNGWRLMYRAT